MTRKGELYRIATILNHKLVERWKKEIESPWDPSFSIGGRCPLYGTYFKAFDFGNNKKKPLVLKVLIFECAT